MQPVNLRPTSPFLRYVLYVGYYLIKQIIQVCYLIQNRHHTLLRLLCAYFTFSGGTQSLRLSRLGNFQRPNSYEGMALSGTFSFSPSSLHEDRVLEFRWELEALRHQLGSKNTKHSTLVPCAGWPFRGVLVSGPHSLRG